MTGSSTSPERRTSVRASLLSAAAIAGLLAGLVTAGFHAVATEPLIDRAVAIEEASDAEHGEDSGHADEGVSRPTQRIGLWFGWGSLGLTWGVMTAAALLLAARLLEFDITTRARLLAGAAGFWVFAGVPALKYPANPPGVGNSDTINERTRLFFGLGSMTLIGILVATLVVVLLARRGLRAWMGAAAGFAIVAVVAVASVLLLPEVVEESVVPADLIGEFQRYSVAGALVFWGAFAAIFTAWPRLRERLAGGGEKARLDAADAR